MNSLRSKDRQSGAALIVCLLLLLVMTLLGTGSMHASILQERMAGNVYDYNQAFQRAENTLRNIEIKVSEKIITSSTAGLKMPSLDWVGQAMESDCSATIIMQRPDFQQFWSQDAVTEQDYVVVPIPKNSPCIPAEEIGFNATEYYWVISRAEGLSGAAVVSVQSIYSMR